MAEEVIGSGFSESVKAQFQAREKLFSSKNRTNDQLLYMNSNGAWARLVSSVNTLTADEVKKLAKFEVGPKDIEGSSNLAYNNVLLGGTKKQAVSNESNYNLKGGVDFTKGYNPIIIKPDQTIQEGNLRTSQYNNYDSLGFRPVPGIESVSIESKNTYGTLREAKIKIVAWTLEDLEVIQALYLRPGYSMLLEWGHSMYIDNSGKLNKNGVGTLYNGFLANKKQTGKRVEKDLNSKREENFNNYDAMYGIVKNFNWSFRQDGGYDCEVTLISKGSILESMSVKFDPSNTLTSRKLTKEELKKTKERVSPFHKFFHDLARIDDTFFDKNTLLKEIPNTEKGNYSKLQYFKGYWIDLDTSSDLDEFEDRGQFITLRTLLDFYNKYVTPINPAGKDDKDSGADKLIEYYTGQGESNQDPYNKKTKYLTTGGHFSIDPMKGILPKKFINPSNFVSTEIRTGTLVPLIYVDINKPILDLKVINKIKQNLNKQIVKGEPDDILNIFLPIHFLSIKIDSILSSENKSEHTMFNIVKVILDNLNDILGGVNDFDQYYDESDDLWYIVDRKVTPIKETQKNHLTLNLTGLQSTITDLNISSKISNEIGAQVSIAAQGTGNNYKEDVSTLLKWNSGLIDRTIPIKTITQKQYDEVKEKEEERLKEKIDKYKEWADNVEDIFEEYNEGGNYDPEDVDYEEEDHNNLKSMHKQYSSEFVIEEYYKDKKDPKPAPGVIPVELSFKTIGIGGLKIGQAFKVATGILPKSYDKNFGYIITGLSHDITGNKWETSIKTQFYSIQNTSKAELEDTGKNKGGNESNAEPIPTPIPTPNPTPPIDPQLDPAPLINTQRIGAIGYSASPLAKKLQKELNFNGLLDLSILEFIGETQGAAKYYINPKTGAPEYMLHPAAAKAWYGWRDEMKTQGVFYSVSSGYRNSKHQGGLDKGRAASPGTSPHGWGGALDFRNLYQEVGGSTNPSTNLNGRINSTEYKKMAEIGKKYGWYNPWRLSDNGGTMDEMWHWEYWGDV